MQEAFLKQQHEAQHRHYTIHFGDAEWMIIACAGEAIGRIYLRDDDEGLDVIDISLVPAFGGQGIGGAILSDVLALAQGLGKGVAIHVEKFNPARRLYERLGFTMVEHLGVYELMRAAP